MTLTRGLQLCFSKNYSRYSSPQDKIRSPWVIAQIVQHNLKEQEPLRLRVLPSWTTSQNTLLEIVNFAADAAGCITFHSKSCQKHFSWSLRNKSTFDPQFTPDAALLRSGSRADEIPFQSMCMFTLDVGVVQSGSVTAPAIRSPPGKYTGLPFLPDARCEMHEFRTKQVTQDRKLGGETQ